MSDELDLSSLSDEDLTQQMHDDLYDGLADEITEGTNILLSRGCASSVSISATASCSFPRYCSPPMR
jgi:methanogenic corrinoid protein MtbC1